MIWLRVKTVVVDPMLVGIGEFTAHFRTYFSEIGMLTEGTWSLHDPLKMGP